MGDTRPIGIFDSGVGGLTIVREIIKKCPNENIVYFGDTARVPYGTKSPKVIEKFALQDILFLLDRHVKLVVAACHTVSSVALDYLVQNFHLPILGVVEPGVKAALEITKNNRVGVIGTRGTIQSGTYERKLNEKRKGVTVISQACPLFVPIAEEGWLNGDVTERIVEIYLSPLQKQGIDTLILGCTHYPLLKSVIDKAFGNTINIIDSAEETAKLVARRLKLIGIENHQKKPVKHDFYVSDIPYHFQEIGERFLGTKLESLTCIDFEPFDFKV